MGLTYELDVANMTAAKYGGGGGIGPTHGFIHGAYPNINVIESFPFAAEGNSADVADLHGVGGMGASMSSQTNAYLCGGFPATDRIQRYPTAAGTAGAGSDHGNLLSSVFNSSGGFL